MSSHLALYSALCHLARLIWHALALTPITAIPAPYSALQRLTARARIQLIAYVTNVTEKSLPNLLTGAGQWPILTRAHARPRPRPPMRARARAHPPALARSRSPRTRHVRPPAPSGAGEGRGRRGAAGERGGPSLPVLRPPTPDVHTSSTRTTHPNLFQPRAHTPATPRAPLDAHAPSSR